MPNKYLTGFASLLLSLASAIGQQAQSLGDIARQARESKANVSKPASSPHPQPIVNPSSKIEGTAADTTNLPAEADPDRFVAGVKLLLQQEKFEELEAVAAAVRNGKTRFPGGGWKLSGFYRAINAPLGDRDASDADWEVHLARLERWASMKPDSITAPVAVASSYRGYAWKARGGGYASEVSETGWRLFAERVKRAETSLQKAAALPARCPHWFFEMQDMALSQGWGKAQTQALFEEAITAEPQYYYYYQVQAHSLLPQWNGDEGEAERFAESSAKRVGGKEGDIIYWLIASKLVCNCGNEGSEDRLSWTTLRRGYDAMVQRYGTSVQRMNAMCFMAMKFGDVFLADKLFAEIGERWDKETWGNKQYFDDMKQFATGGMPYERKQQGAYLAVNENLQTPEGRQYDTLVSKEFEEATQECAGPVNNLPSAFDLVMKIGEDGKVRDMVCYPMTKANVCLISALRKASFSHPPKPEYWVRVNRNFPF
jgi:hypothetical protein